LAQLLRRCVVGAGKREEPVHVRVFQPVDQTAGAAGATGALRLRRGAYEQLRQPESQAFLADATMPVQQDGLGERAASRGEGDASSDLFVTSDLGKAHARVRLRN